MLALIDISGKTFGRLTVSSRAAGPGPKWHCLCSCGNSVIVRGEHLRSGSTRSCGCLNNETRKRGKHQLSKTSEYHIWQSMKDRCENQNNRAFKNYGGRGIKVCDRWHDVANFVADMGRKPDGLSLDRIDNDGNYEPGNCRWATYREQSNNQRKNVFVTYRGQRMSFSEAWRLSGTTVDNRTARFRFATGWALEDAFKNIRRRPTGNGALA